MLARELLQKLDELAPFRLAEPWDNVGLLVGDPERDIRSVLVSLELTAPVLEEVLAGGYGAIVTHHPFLFSPVRSLVENEPRQGMLRRLVSENIALFACHTNLDAAKGGLADILAEALDLEHVQPLARTLQNWVKLVGFIPRDALDGVSAAVFAAGAGEIGEYSGCAFAAEGQGWFTPGEKARPAVGEALRSERVPEVRWETVVPRSRLAAAVSAFIQAHPYEEPAFDIAPVEDVAVRTGLGRVGTVKGEARLDTLAARAAAVLGLGSVHFAGAADSPVRRVAVIPGSDASTIEDAAAAADVLITGDLRYHDADRAAALGLCLVDVPHAACEAWAFARWAERLAEVLRPAGVGLAAADAWRPAWNITREGTSDVQLGLFGETTADAETLRVRVDGGARGNPGPAAIGVVLEDGDGRVIAEIGRCLGIATNNVAEYTALLAGLEAAVAHGARRLEVLSDSELLVKQINGQYKVRNEGLRELHEQAKAALAAFERVLVRHVPREENAAADGLVNRALDEA